MKSHAGISSVYDRNVHKRSLPPLKRSAQEKLDKSKVRYGATTTIIADLVTMNKGDLRVFKDPTQYDAYSRGCICLTKAEMGEYHILAIRGLPDPAKKFTQKTFQGNIKTFQRSGEICEFRVYRLS